MESTGSAWNDEVVLVKQGDEAAARRLVERLYPHVVRILRAHLPNRSDEEDAAQEVFLKMFTKIEQWRGDQGFDHWVARIAVNHCRDRLRQHRSRRVVTYSDLGLEEAALLSQLEARQADDTPPTQPEAARSLVAKLLTTLNDREQLVLRMLDLEQRPVREIAELTGWGESKIKVTAMRARRKLADRLSDWENLQRP